MPSHHWTDAENECGGNEDIGPRATAALVFGDSISVMNLHLVFTADRKSANGPLPLL